MRFSNQRQTDESIRIVMRTDNTRKYVGHAFVRPYPNTKFCIIDDTYIHPDMRGNGYSWYLTDEIHSVMAQLDYDGGIHFVSSTNEIQRYRCEKQGHIRQELGFCYFEVDYGD